MIRFVTTGPAGAITASLALAFLTTLGLSAVSATGADAQPIAITNGLIVTNGDAGVLDGGTIIFEGERIIAVGVDLELPADALILDVGGKWVTPGLFSAFSRVGLVEVGAESSTDDRAAGEGTPFTIALDAEVGFNPSSSAIGVARHDGLTRTALVPATGTSLFAGRGAVVNTSRETDSDVRSGVFIYADFSAGGLDHAGGTRSSALAFLEAALDDAVSSPRWDGNDDGLVLNRTDAQALRAVARGDIPLMIAADRASDLLLLANLAEQRSNLRLIVVGGVEAHLVATELADASVAVILDPSANLPQSFDAIGASFKTAQVLEAAGVEYAIVALAWDSSAPGLLTQNAGIAVAHGLDWSAALDAITGAPARIFGLDDDLGALEPGKLADIVVWDGDPLEVMSGADRVFIAGTEYALRSRQTVLRDRYLQLNADRDLPLGYVTP